MVVMLGLAINVTMEHYGISLWRKIVYKEIKANETNMQLLHFKKSLGDENPKISTDNTLINEKVKVRKLIEGYRDEVSIQFVTIGEILKRARG